MSDPPTSEAPPAEAPAAAEPIAPLKRPWLFWFYKPNKKDHSEAAFMQALEKIGEEFDTVQAFWQYFANLPKVTQLESRECFHLFRRGVEPKWEDPECVHGGQWQFKVNADVAQDMWKNLLFATVGECCADADDICGLTAKGGFRGSSVNFMVWNKSSAKQDVVKQTLEKFLEEQNLKNDIKEEWKYQLHQEALSH